ncbi:MAG: BrnA antitoxin family protein [Gallionella sp.]|nr:BrnA antitoxin family protein [Gallionella sp.]
MKKIAAEPYRDIDFSLAKQGAVIQPAVGKMKISIRLDNRVIEYFRGLVDADGEGNYQTLINDALVTYIQQRSLLEAVRQVVREEITPTKTKARTVRGSAVHA